MGITGKEVKEFEEKSKKEIWDRIDEVISTLSTSIKSLKKIGKRIGIETEIPNIGITYNNKVVEISNIFKNAGISMYADVNKELEIIDFNFVGEAIFSDISSQLQDGADSIQDCNSIIIDVINRKSQQISVVENYGPIKTFFFRLKGFFNPNVLFDLILYPEEDLEMIDQQLLEYKNIDEKLWQYNLKDDLARSLAKFMIEEEYEYKDIPSILNDFAGDILKKLGMEDIIPQVYQELEKIEKSSESVNKKPWEISDEEKIEIQRDTETVAKEFNGNSSVQIDNQETER